MRLRVTICLLFATCAVSGAPGQSGQTTAVAAPEVGTVTGRVFCSDTRRPARLARVRFVPAGDFAGDSPRQSPGTDPFGSPPPIETDMDGRFVEAKLKPGRYYVRVDLDGYLTPLLSFSPEQLNHPTPEIQKRLRNELTEVTVTPHAPAEVEVSLMPAASLSGTVLYDDGAPAIGLFVNLLRKDAKGAFHERVETGNLATPTDEHGRFHLNSLPAGDYVAEVNLDLWKQVLSTISTPTGMIRASRAVSVAALSIFSGDVFRLRDAVPLTLDTAEDRSGLVITVPLSKLHSVSGTLVARDGHALNAGRVSLRYTGEDDGLTSVEVDRETRQFVFLYVPDGAYTLTVEDARDVTGVEAPNGPGFTPATRLEEKTVRGYAKTEQPLIVQNDVENVIAIVPDAKKDPGPGTTSSGSAAASNP